MMMLVLLMMVVLLALMMIVVLLLMMLMMSRGIKDTARYHTLWGLMWPSGPLPFLRPRLLPRPAYVFGGRGGGWINGEIKSRRPNQMSSLNVWTGAAIWRRGWAAYYSLLTLSCLPSLMVPVKIFHDGRVLVLLPLNFCIVGPSRSKEYNPSGEWGRGGGESKWKGAKCSLYKSSSIFLSLGKFWH